MTTIAKLFEDARQGVKGLSGRTDHFSDLEIGGLCFEGALIVRRRRKEWLCSITAYHHSDGREFDLFYSERGDNAGDALGKAEASVDQWATWLAGMLA